MRMSRWRVKRFGWDGCDALALGDGAHKFEFGGLVRGEMGDGWVTGQQDGRIGGRRDGLEVFFFPLFLSLLFLVSWSALPPHSLGGCDRYHHRLYYPTTSWVCFCSIRILANHIFGQRILAL